MFDFGIFWRVCDLVFVVFVGLCWCLVVCVWVLVCFTVCWINLFGVVSLRLRSICLCCLVVCLGCCCLGLLCVYCWIVGVVLFVVLLCCLFVCWLLLLVIWLGCFGCCLIWICLVPVFVCLLWLLVCLGIGYLVIYVVYFGFRCFVDMLCCMFGCLWCWLGFLLDNSVVAFRCLFTWFYICC